MTKQRSQPGGRRTPDRDTGDLQVPEAGRLWPAALAATAAAFLTRVGFIRAWSEPGSLASPFYFGDTRAFLSFASHLVAGREFDQGVPFHPPGWPLALAAFYRAMGYAPEAGVPADPLAIELFVAAISGLSVGLATAAAGRLAGRGAMWAVALLGTFHFGHMVLGTTPTSEALYGLLVVAALIAADRWLRADRAREETAWRRMVPAASLGVISATAALVRAEFVLAALAFGMLGARGLRDRPGRRGELAAYVLAFLVTLVPSTVWHWRSISHFNESRADRLPGPLPRFAPITSYGAFNFAMANHPDADGGPNHDHPLLQELSNEELLVSEGGLDLGHPVVHRLYVGGYAEGLRWMARDPAAAVALMTRRAWMASQALSQGYLANDVPAGVAGTRRRVDMIVPDRMWLWPIHAILIVGGVRALRPRRLTIELLGATLLSLAASTLLFFGYVRLGAAYLPVFWILQGAALARLAARLPWSNRIRRHAGAVVLAIGVTLLVVEAAASRFAHRVTLVGPRDVAGRVVQDETLEIRVQDP